MKKILMLGVISILGCFSTLSFATPLQPLNSEQLKTAVAGNTMTTIPLITLNHKLMNNTMTVYFARKGKLHGQMSNKLEESPQTDNGIWMVKPNNILCVTWQHWNQKTPICVNVYSLNNSIIFVNIENNNFESLVLKENIKSGDHLS